MCSLCRLCIFTLSQSKPWCYYPDWWTSLTLLQLWECESCWKGITHELAYGVSLQPGKNWTHFSEDSKDRSIISCKVICHPLSPYVTLWFPVESQHSQLPGHHVLEAWWSSQDDSSQIRRGPRSLGSHGRSHGRSHGSHGWSARCWFPTNARDAWDAPHADAGRMPATHPHEVLGGATTKGKHGLDPSNLAGHSLGQLIHH